LKAAYLYKPQDIRIDDAPTNELGPLDLRLDVTAVGICGSDLHTYLSGTIGDTVATAPLILGHEAAGRIVEVGHGLAGKWRVGQTVAIDPAIPCGECERCEKGDPNLCTNLKFIGLWPQHGALREQMVHPAKSCIALPDGITPVSAALLEPLGVALHAINLSKIRLGDDVLVVGCGAIGLLLIRLARLAGARHIYASDKHQWRLDMAADFGADVLVDYSQQDVVAEVMRRTDHRGVDVAIESAWASSTVNQCVDAARNGGRVIIVGIPAEDFLTFRASASRRKGLTIKLSRRMKHSYPPSIALATSGQVNLEPLGTHRFSLAETAKAFDTAATYADGVIRAMVLPTN
jgi:L-iditol 2-dehydrogenase